MFLYHMCINNFQGLPRTPAGNSLGPLWPFPGYHLTPLDPQVTPKETPRTAHMVDCTGKLPGYSGISPIVPGWGSDPPDRPHVTRQNAHAFYHMSLGGDSTSPPDPPHVTQ